jgi:hypothetical protein
MKGAADVATYGVYFTEPASAQAVDMDGESVPDIVTGKMRFAHPLDQNDPDPHGTPFIYVFKTVQEMHPGVSGKAHFEITSSMAARRARSKGPPSREKALVLPTRRLKRSPRT